MPFYDGTKILSLKDIDGFDPDLYLCTSNRSAGKTTFFGRWFVRRYVKQDEKFVLLYRWGYELQDVATKFFNDLEPLFFPGYKMTDKQRHKGIYTELFLTPPDSDTPQTCGYALALNKADQIKKVSHIFNEVQRMLFDEFMPETGEYCSNEIEKFYSIHKSIARGHGEQVRRVPVYMISNPVTILNPYYAALGISDRLNADTKFLRGRGWVMEQGYNDSAKQAEEQSGFYKALGGTKYGAYGAQGVYLSDSDTFIQPPNGRGQYLATIRYNGVEFAVRAFPNEGIVYCDKAVDSTFPHKLAVTTDDHQINYVMLAQYRSFVEQMRYFFERGSFRFFDQQSKQAILQALSYR